MKPHSSQPIGTRPTHLFFHSPLPCYETTQQPTGRNQTNAALFSFTAAMLWSETAEQSESARSQKSTQLSMINHGYCMNGWPLHNKRSGDSSVVRGTEHQTRDWKVAGLSSQQENVLLQGQLCVLALISVSIPPCVPAVAHKRSLSFCQKCRWQVAAKHMSTLCTGLWMKWHCKLVHGCMVYTEQAPRWKKFQTVSAM